MMALSGVRNSWLMVARKRLLAALARSASVRASSSACSCRLRSVTSRSTATTSRRSGLPASTVACSSGRQRISIHTNCTAGRPFGVGSLAPHAELDRTALAERRGIAERGQISGAVGDMDAIEQTRARAIRRYAQPNSDSRCRRNKQHGAVAAVPRDHVGHVARQQPVTVLLGVEQPETGARQRLGAEREPRRVERGRDDAERGKRRRVRRCRAAATDRARRKAPAGRRHRARTSRRWRRRGATPKATPRAARPRARWRRRRRCRRSTPRPPSPVRSRPATTAHARSRSGRCGRESRR